MNRPAQIVLALLAAPLLLGPIVPLQTRIDAHSQSLRRPADDLLFRSGRILKKLSLGYDSLLADIYWTRTVQYYGGKRRDHDAHFDSLWPLLDVTTTLDPHLLPAYKFGALFLAESPPRGAGQPELAATLVRRGISSNPQEWRFYVDLGFIYYWDERDYRKASETYLAGSRQPGAQPWMSVMAAKIAEEGESPRTSYFLWKQVYDTTPDPVIRRNAFEHLEALTAQEDLSQLALLVEQYSRQFHHLPADLRDLIAARMLRGQPLDPAGFPYTLSPAGTPMLNPSSPVDLKILQPVLPR